jgi:predicted nucleic-acid-binding Zn-ribbon protein
LLSEIGETPDLNWRDEAQRSSRIGPEKRRLRQDAFWNDAKSRMRSANTKELQTSGFRATQAKILDISNSQFLDCCVESCDHTLAVIQAAAFAVFFFDFDNGAVVGLAACFTAAQRLICA